ncbi:hypothetical protein ACFL0B_00065 [Thermodesulfobacteriota bacterium]
MCFNDNFDFDGYDDMDDPGDDFSEDILEDEFEPEMDELEAENDEPFAPESEGPESTFDFQDAFILGGIIVGQAYEEALDEKEQQRQLRNENKDED